MREKTESVGFSIDGKWLADFSRTRVEEGDYQHALRILDCLSGMSLDDKVAILKGEKDLDGVNELNLIDGSKDLKKLIDEKYQWKYGSLLKFEGNYYKPYMIINSWSAEDLPERNAYYSSLSKKFTDVFESELYDKMYKMFGGNKLNGFPHSRSLHYAYHPQNDLAYSFKTEDYKKVKHGYENGVILFEEFKEQVPFWVDGYIKKHPQEAIESALKNRQSFIREGAEYLYDDNRNIEKSPMKIDNPYLYGDRYSKIETEEDEEAAIEDLRSRIIEYANNDKEYGWKIFEDSEGRTIKVPGRAFMHFALERCIKTSINNDFSYEESNLRTYSPFSKSGLKMQGDDPYHSDSWLGAGFDLNKAYDHDSWEYDLFMQAVWDMQYSDKMEFNIINRGKKLNIKGITVNINNYESVPKGERILVIPNLSVDFEQAFFACDHIICETGGKLAHLATLAREFDKSIIRVKNATLQFIKKNPISIDFETGKIDYKTKQENKFKP